MIDSETYETIIDDIPSQDDTQSCRACDDGWAICSSFARVDDEDNFDVCSNCQAHRLDHTEVNY